MNVEQRVQWVENIMEENARLMAENAQLKDIEKANKETIQYWRSRVAELEEALNKLVELLATRPSKKFTRRDKNDMMQLAWEQAIAALGKE